MEELFTRIEEAWQRRAELRAAPATDCFRLFHGYSEGAMGLEIDLYGPVARVRYRNESATKIQALAEHLVAEYPVETVVHKHFDGSRYESVGAVPPESYVGHEGGLRFAIEIMQAGNPGLYLDARPAREWLRANSGGRRILNLFSFTGSLGVAASAGGAKGVTHVDVQKRALERCRENYRLNDLRIDERDLARVNVYQHLRRASAKRRQFDGVIIDAPPGPHLGSHSSWAGLASVAPSAAQMLADDGWILCFFHRSEKTHAELEADFVAAAQTPLKVTWRGLSGDDFPEADLTRKLRLSAFSKV